MPKTKKVDKLAELKARLQELRSVSPPSDSARKRFRRDIDAIVSELQDISRGHDPVERPTSVFDPTVPSIAGRMIALTLIAQDRQPLGAARKFYGSGVYAVFYRGEFEAYAPISRTEHPIYVGKADPASAHAKDPTSQGTKLWERLKEHAGSIRNTVNLDISDFDCRFLVVASGWQRAAEDYLINVFSPVWNNISYGIGKHGDAATTRSNRRSPWDTMHPGRKWATPTAEDQRSLQQIEGALAEHFRVEPPLRSRDEIIARLLDDMKQKRPG